MTCNFPSNIPISPSLFHHKRQRYTEILLLTHFLGELVQKQYKIHCNNLINIMCIGDTVMFICTL